MSEVEGAVIDTNVLIYDLVEDSVYHVEASGLLDGLGKWYIPMIVFHELVWVLRELGVSVGDVLDLVSQYAFSRKAVVVCEEFLDVISSLKTIASEGLSLSRYNDKVILHVACRLKMPLATFDRRLRMQANRMGLITLP